MTTGIIRPNTEISTPNSASINTHSSIEPSWLAQTPVTLYSIGLDECEFSATLTSEKSEMT